MAKQTKTNVQDPFDIFNNDPANLEFDPVDDVIIDEPEDDDDPSDDPEPEPEPTPKKKEVVPDVDDDNPEDEDFSIIAKSLGEKWGWGEDDFKALTESGYDFREFDGLVSFIENVIEENSKSRSFASDEVLAINEYIAAGGSLNQFFKEYYAEPESFDGLTEDSVKKSEILQEKVYRASLEAKGFKPERIEKLVKNAKEIEDLEEFALDGLTELKEREVKRKAEVVEKQKEQQKLHEAQLKAEQTGVKETIEKIEEIAGYKLTSKVRKEFFDYLYAVDPKTGLTGRQSKYKKEPDIALKVAFLEFMGVDKHKIEAKAQSPVVKQLIERMGRPTETGAKGKTADVTVKRDVSKAEKLLDQMFGDSEE